MIGGGASGSGSIVRVTSATLITPALGTPSALVLTNATGLPLTTGVTGTLPHGNLGTGGGGSTKFLREDSTWQTLSGAGDALVANPLSQFAATTSAQLAATITNETGSGSLVFATSPTLVTPILGTPTSGTLTNATGLPLTTGVTGTLPIANGGTGAASAQAGLDLLTDVVTATNEHVLTKDTATGNAIFKAQSGGLWTDSTTTAYLTTTTDDVVIGANSPVDSAKFSVNGDADQIQAVIQAHSTQNDSILEVQKSDSTVMMAVTTTGMTVGGTTASISASGGITINIKPRITTIVSNATPTVNTDNCDAVTITALAAAITSMTTNLSGTILNFQKLVFRIKDDGTARAITWGAKFVARGVTLPTTTVLSKVLTVGFLGNSVADVWDCVASAQEA